MKRKTLVVLFAMLAVPGFLFAQGKGGTKKSNTAQSIQLSFDSSKTDIVQAGGTWSFPTDDATLDAAFDTYFTAVTSGSVPGLAGRKRTLVTDNSTNFFCGNALQGSSGSGGGSPGWSFTFTPKSSDPVAAESVWTFTPGEGEDSDGAIELTNIFIAAQSFVQNDKKQDKWTEKYSFDLGTTEYSRVENVTFSLILDVDGDLETTTDDQTVVDFDETATHEIVSGEDWEYAAYPGMTFGSATAKLQNGLVSGILLSDDFLGNDYVGGSKAVFADRKYEITAPGHYFIKITGVVKGNELIGTQGFSVIESVGTVLGAPSCGAGEVTEIVE